MAIQFTYDENGATAKDRARLRLSDNVQSTALLDDREITSTLTRYGYVEGCAMLAEVKAAKYAERASEFTEADVRKSYMKRADQFYDLADRIRKGTDLDSPVVIDPDDEGSAVGQLARPDLTGYKTD